MKARDTAAERREVLARAGHIGGLARVPKGFAMMSVEQIRASSAKGLATRRANAAARVAAKQEKWS